MGSAGGKGGQVAGIWDGVIDAFDLTAIQADDWVVSVTPCG